MGEKEKNSTGTESEIKKAIIVDYTSFDIREEKTFFNKTMDEIKFDLLQHCNTTIIHKTTDYELSVINKVETIVNKPIEVSMPDENTFDLIDARRKIRKVSQRVINSGVAEKLRSSDLFIDEIIMNDRLD